ncbi:Phospholipid phosphatase 2 [Halotydeus destructor]|nr:Phospholipid phosphatase 2 [Halotydeus destructor]
MIFPLKVSFMQIILGSLAFPLFVIVTGQCLLKGQSFPWPLATKFTYTWVVIGILVTYIKNLVGRLRPNFYAANKIEFDCNDHQIYEPSNDDIRKLAGLENMLARESRFSFFSGHAMLGMYAASFIVIYIQENYSTNLYLHTIQLAAILVGLYPGLTQAQVYWHHWSDVAVGHAVGVVSAYVAYYHVHL